MLAIKFLGIIDILAALMIFFNTFPPIITMLFFVILLAKGAMSLAADMAGKFLGVVDIIASFVILFGTELHVVIKLVIVVVLVAKGGMSLI